MQSSRATSRKLGLEINPENGVILSIDAELEQMLGFPAGHLKGRRASDLRRLAAESSGFETGSVARLFADSTHDLVSPLNQVSTLLSLLARKNQGLRSDPASLEILGHIDFAVKRMRTLADGLRTVSRMLAEPLARDSADTGELVAAALRNCANKIDAAEAQVSVKGLPKLSGDSRRLTFLFEELIQNALKFRGDARPEIDISAEPHGGDWLFAVRDNGCGFDAQAERDVFRIFSRLDPDRSGGSGVGLTICRQIVELHGGKMWIDSEPGRGSTVRFTLPQTAEA